MTAIEFINHASFLLRLPGVNLVCDPWLDGTAFKGGWSLTTPSVFGYDRFSEVTHLWISHQHPDHFAPANLRKIPLADRQRMTVLYQKTSDKLIVSWLRSNGFRNVVEVTPRRWINIAPDVEIALGTLTDDSWLAVRSEGRTILNVNDCVLKTREVIDPIAEVVGKADILLTQFSYAQWVGNPEELERRRYEAREKMERMLLQNEILRPDYIVPFACFMYFCHEENFFLNEGLNSVYDVASFIESDVRKTPVVLYPGEVWNLDAPAPDWHASARRWCDDFERCIAGGPIEFGNSLDPYTVFEHIEAFLRRLSSKNPRAHALLGRRSVTVYATDAGRAFEISSRRIKLTSRPERECDIITSLENVLYAFRAPWGGNTLHASGRFLSYVEGGHKRFFRFVRALHHYNITPVDLRWAHAQVMRVPRGIGRRIAKRMPRRVAAYAS